MSFQTSVVVPEGMSFINAFYALWSSSDTASILRPNPKAVYEETKYIDSPEKILNIFERSIAQTIQSRQLYFDYEGGRMMKTDFKYFPKLYVRRHNENALLTAQGALDDYNNVPPHSRFDKNDTYNFHSLIRRKHSTELSLLNNDHLINQNSRTESETNSHSVESIGNACADYIVEKFKSITCLISSFRFI